MALVAALECTIVGLTIGKGKPSEYPDYCLQRSSLCGVLLPVPGDQQHPLGTVGQTALEQP